MDVKVMGFTVLALFCTSSLAVAMDDAHVHRFLTGEVTKIVGTIATLKTQERTTRNVSLKDAEKEGIVGLHVGDNLFLEFDEGNQIIDIDRVTKEGTLEHADEHQSVLGQVVTYDRVKKEVVLTTPDQRSKTYRLKDAAATKMNNIQAGTSVLLKIDEENNLVNDFLMSHQ